MFGFGKSKAKEENKEEQPGIFKRLQDGLSSTSSKISTGITDIFTKRKLDKQALTELEELLITADLGVTASVNLVKKIAENRFDKEVDDEEIKQSLATEIENIISPYAKQLDVSTSKPFVILMAGVNGTGKTTAIGKMAYKLNNDGYKVMMAAGDTFRAAAVQQLQSWGRKIGCEVVSKPDGSDAAALVFEALDRAVNENVDVLFIDTAGRLQNKEGLMEELRKIYRVIKKKMPEAPHASIIALDATVGQNAHSQVDLFKQAVDLTGMIITKLDGTAKGGVVVSLVDKFKLPVYAIGIGEQIEDLREFDAKDYSRTLVGLE